MRRKLPLFLENHLKLDNQLVIAGQSFDAFFEYTDAIQMPFFTGIALKSSQTACPLN
jgi:hypothetical protein